MGALPLLMLALCSVGHVQSAFSQRPAYSLYNNGGGAAHGAAHGSRAASRHRNWCAFVVTRSVSCVVEDGVETYVKPEYRPCNWGSGQCNRVVMYRTFMKPRYRVSYKTVTEMQWKCCHGFSGADCNHGSEISNSRQGGGASGTGGGGAQGGRPESDRMRENDRTRENDRLREMEEKIQVLTRSLQDLRHHGSRQTGQSGDRSGEGTHQSEASNHRSLNPADAAQPEMKETIYTIQTKLDQLENRTKAHDKTLSSINNHLVNGNDPAGNPNPNPSLKEEILRELERRVALSCSACQSGVEDLRRQQQTDRETIRSLEKQLKAQDARHRQSLDGLRREGGQDRRCCDEVTDLQSRITDAERKITSASENFDVIYNRLDKELEGRGGEGPNPSNPQGGGRNPNTGNSSKPNTGGGSYPNGGGRFNPNSPNSPNRNPGGGGTNPNTGGGSYPNGGGRFNPNSPNSPNRNPGGGGTNPNPNGGGSNPNTGGGGSYPNGGDRSNPNSPNSPNRNLNPGGDGSYPNGGSYNPNGGDRFNPNPHNPNGGYNPNTGGGGSYPNGGGRNPQGGDRSNPNINTGGGSYPNGGGSNPNTWGGEGGYPNPNGGTADKPDHRWNDLERRINNTVHRSCSLLEKRLADLRSVFLDRFDDQTFRISDVELDVGLVKDRVRAHDERLSRLENSTSSLGKGSGGEGGGPGANVNPNREGGSHGAKPNPTDGERGGTHTPKPRPDGPQTGWTGGEGPRGGASGTHTPSVTQKSLEWRVVANENQIRHFNTRLRDLSVSGDNLHHKVLDLSQDVVKIKVLSGDHGLNLTEEELLHSFTGDQNNSQNALGRLQSLVHSLAVRLDQRESCCSQLEDKLRLLRADVSRCSGECNTGPDTPTGVGAGRAGPSGAGLDQRPLDGHSVISSSNHQLKSLQRELSHAIVSFSAINDTLRGLEHTVTRHSSVITDLGNTKDKLISELDKIQLDLTDQREESGERLGGVSRALQRVESSLTLTVSDCRRSDDALEKRLSKLEGVCGRLDGVSESIAKIKDGLTLHVSSLWSCVSGLNSSLVLQGETLDFTQKVQEDIYSRMKNLNSSLIQVTKSLSERDHMGVAGPPGERGRDGAPGPKGEPGLPGAALHLPRLSFSAALTVPMDQSGTIVFDRLFVNEGDFYDARTGIFTAPLDGHYFFSAVLTGHRNQQIEAVLSQSNYGMARVDSGGYQPEGLENNPIAEAKSVPGSLAVFNIILPLHRGDTVCIDLVTGQLAHSVEPLTMFSGMLLYEDL